MTERSLTEEDVLQKNLNLAFAQTIEGLVAEKFLTYEQGHEIVQNYGLVAVKHSWFHQLARKFLGAQQDSTARFSEMVKFIRAPVQKDKG